MGRLCVCTSRCILIRNLSVRCAGSRSASTSQGIRRHHASAETRPVRVVNDVAEGIYPWDLWGDGQRWLLTQGEDFSVDIASFRAGAYQAARHRGKRCKTKVHSDTEIEVCFLPPRPPRVDPVTSGDQWSTVGAEVSDHG